MSYAATAAALDLPEETPLATTRRRLAAGRCARCAARLDGSRRTVCAACAATWAYCPTCETVQPLTVMKPPTGSARRKGMAHGGVCRACYNARRAAPPAACRRCGGVCARHRRLCAACVETHGYCPRCDKVRSLAAFKRPAGRRRHASYCRACDAADKRSTRREERRREPPARIYGPLPRIAQRQYDASRARVAEARALLAGGAALVSVAAALGYSRPDSLRRAMARHQEAA